MKFNKIIALILSVVFILSVNVTGFAAEEGDSLFEPAVYNEIITFLSTLGVIDAEYYAIDAPLEVTRGEFAEAAAKMIGIGPLTNFAADFSDVPAEHSHASYIYAMKNAGYMSGVSADAFLPDEPIYFEQAVSVLVKLAGYNDVALATGGYPAGYLTIATRIGILDNLDNTMGTPLTKGLLLELTKNTVLCDILIPESFGTSTSYVTREGVNILSHYHKIYEGTGIVDADSIYTMGSERAAVGEVIIAGVTYQKPDELYLSNIVGRKVNFFYKTKSNVRTLVYVKADDIKEISFVVDPYLDFSYSAGTYTYETTEKTLTYKIGYNYHVVYNTAELYPVIADKMLPTAGTVTLIDNDTDGTYEVIIVDEFTNIVVGRYSEVNDKITDIIDPNRVIDFNKYESYQFVDPLGAPYAKTDLYEYDIIEFYETADKKSFTGIVKRTGMTKTIDAKDEKYVYSGSEQYPFSGDFRGDKSALILGAEYKIYLNSKDELVYWLRGDDLKFGYILDVKAATSGFDSKASAKIYDNDGKLFMLPLAEKITNYTTSGTTVSSARLERTAYSTIFPETNHREYVGYKVNSAGEIVAVYHPMILTDLDTIKNINNKLPEYPLYRLDYYNTNATLSGTKANSINNQLLMPTEAPILVVPPVTLDVDENNLKVITSVKSAFYDNLALPVSSAYTGAAKTFAAYMFGNEYPFVSTMVYHNDVVSGGTNFIKSNTTDLMITNIRHVYDPETFEEKIIIEGIENKSNKTIELPNDYFLTRASFEKVLYVPYTWTVDDVNDENKAKNYIPVLNDNKKMIEVGDFIDYTTNTKGEVTAIALLFDASNKALVNNANNRSHLLGEVTYVGNGGIEIKEAETENILRFDVSPLYKYVFEADKSKNYKADSTDFEVGDTVYITGHATGLSTIIVYK